MSFWRNTDAKDNIWVDLRPLEGWGTSDRNYFITWEVHCFVKMLQYWLEFLTFLLFSRTKNTQTNKQTKPIPKARSQYTLSAKVFSTLSCQTVWAEERKTKWICSLYPISVSGLELAATQMNETISDVQSQYCRDLPKRRKQGSVSFFKF